MLKMLFINVNGQIKLFWYYILALFIHKPLRQRYWGTSSTCLHILCGTENQTVKTNNLTKKLSLSTQIKAIPILFKWHKTHRFYWKWFVAQKRNDPCWKKRQDNGDDVPWYLKLKLPKALCVKVIGGSAQQH